MPSGHKLHIHHITTSTKTRDGGGDVIKAIEWIVQLSSVAGLVDAGANTLYS
jgi:hypothetical protein